MDTKSIDNQLKQALLDESNLILSDSLLKQLTSNKKRPLYLHEWLLNIDTKIPKISKTLLKQQQVILIGQLFYLFNQFPGPAIRNLIAKNMASLYSHGDFLSLYSTIEKCNDFLKSKEHETQLNQMAKLCALNCLGELYERLGRTCGTMYEDTIQILIKYMKSAESQVRIEIVQTFEKIITGLGTAGSNIHRDIYKQLKPLVQDRNLNVRSAVIKCLCEMIKHCTFFYLPSNLNNLNLGVSNELESSVQLGLKGLDNSNFDVRIQISIYLAQLIYYSILNAEKQPGTNDEKSQKIKNILSLLSNGFNKTNAGFSGFTLVRTKTLPNSNSSNSLSSTETSPNQKNSDLSTNQLNPQTSKELRIGITYAYIELANLLGSFWLEKNLSLFLTHILNLVNNTKCVQNHLDAVYSRKCVQFILRSIIGGMLNEKVQLQCAFELINLIEKLNSLQNTQHILICSIHELSCILKNLNTSCSILISEDHKLMDKLFQTLMYPNVGVKCITAWCLRSLTNSLPSLMSSLLDTCMDKLSLIRNPSDALSGYGYACSALIGAIHQCPLGVPSLKPKLGFNIGEELLRSASQSSNINLAMQKTGIGWLLIGSFMTLGPTLIRKHFTRIKKLWTLTLPSNLEQIDLEKKRGDSFTWQLSLETRSGALSSMLSFLQNNTELLEDESICQGFNQPIQSAILLLAQLPSILKLNANSVNLKAQSAMYRLKLYQCLCHLPIRIYENSLAVLLSELVAEFTMADQVNSNYVTSLLRSVCHSNDLILFAGNMLQDSEYKSIEDQLAPFSASGCETLEHDVTYLYQKNPKNGVHQSALPLGVSVIDASILLFGQIYPKCPNKHRLQILQHFIDLIQKQKVNKQALQINIFTSVLNCLKNLAEGKHEIGDEPIRKATLKLIMEFLSHSSPILRCAAGEALGRMAQVVSDSHFINEIGLYCFEKLRNSQEVTPRTGYALGLGCLHRYVGTMGAGQQMTSTVSVLFAMAQNPSSVLVQVWAIHALYLIIDSGGSMFRNFIEPCVEFIVQSVLSIPLTNRDVFLGLGKLLSSLITFMGPELQLDDGICDSILTTCIVMKRHFDSMIKSEAIQCLQEMHLFAPKLINLKDLVPYLLNSLVSKDFVLRKVSVNCLRQLCQKNSLDVCKLAKDYVVETQPSGLLCLISERGLEFLLFKMLDIETNPVLIRDIHDILYSLLCTTLNEITLKDWLFLCKDIAISAEESLVGNTDTSSKDTSKKTTDKTEETTENDENDEFDDDSLSFNKNSTSSGPSFSSNLQNTQDSQNLKLKQVTKIISPKWPNRVFAFDLIRRIISMCSEMSSEQSNSDNLKQRAHFDLSLAKKLQSKPANFRTQDDLEEHYLILFLQDLMRIACIGATSSLDPLKLVGLDLLHDLILYFGKVEEPNPEFKGHLILEQYQAQVSAALRPQFSIETSAHVTAKACQVCSMWISSGVARDLNDLRRVHQLLVSSLQKLNSNKSINTPMVNNDQLIYSELSLTVEKLAVLRAWADVYIVAHRKSGSENLLNLVKPELEILSHHWSVALKDYSFLCLPPEYSTQLPIEGGAFYHADLVESSKPIYKEHFTKILLAYTVWLNEIKFDVNESDDFKEKLFFMLLGLSLETLSNTQGLAQLSDETIQDILESIDYLLRIDFARKILKSKSVYLCVEILSILYKIKLTRDLMSINILVIGIVKQVNELWIGLDRNEMVDETKLSKNEKDASSLIFVILEICIKDLIKYLPSLLQNKKTLENDVEEVQEKMNPESIKLTSNKSSFLYLHVTKCIRLTQMDVNLLKKVFNVLIDLPFHFGINSEKRISLVAIVYHILFNLIQSTDTLLNKADIQSDVSINELEKILYESIYDSFRVLCSTSSNRSEFYSYFESESQEPLFNLIQIQQSSLITTLNLKNTPNLTIMKLLSLYFQYCSVHVFEPLNVYEKCKVFMCSMRCSDNKKELLCMIESLNEILSNKKTCKKIRIILLREHLSYLCKLTSSTNDLESNSFISLSSENGFELIKSLLDLFESMVSLTSEDSEDSLNETLTIYVHILGAYLNEEVINDTKLKRKQGQLNEIVIKKLVNLGVNYKQELKLVMDKWPDLKNKIGNAFKASANQTSNETQATSKVSNQSLNSAKTPKIQLNFNFSKK
ncbi:unnamed protein product [Brachionus calyciflorus]|uniref:HEAT repeat-containing protein 5B n=1 Tax=Brachionus calyciflorus TaxID=104777 RepID=A0A814BL11_9BILA|nr:unnamed protein product [Brachionus calyciflorus]